ncbi:MAG: Ig-like domain-containing protein [Bacteroidaceae bacterium]|nr:Ig-like domain-containing protein [Bacteroidaceae bacterium]
MKQKLLKLMLLLAVGMMGVSAWGDSVTLQYSGSTTTNMDGTNQAATLGLTATDWSVVGDKGSNSNFPGLNKAGDVRLYYAASGSNTLTISSLTGATITSITITYISGYANGKVLVGSTEVTGTDGTYNINSSSFVVTNGNTSNTQVRFSQIEITYTPSATPNPTIGFATASVLIPVGENYTQTATTDNISGTVVYSSDDTDVATVDPSTGEVTAVAAGTATITASVAADGIDASYDVEVVEIEDGVFDFSLGYNYGSGLEFGSVNTQTHNATYTAGNITLTTAGTGNSCLWANDKTLRIYTSESFTIAAPTGNVITAIEFTGKNVGTASVSTGTLSGTIWSGISQTVTFTRDGDNLQYNKIEVTYMPATYTRSTASGNYGTLCLPYDATVEGATLYTIAGKEITGSEVTALVLAEAASVEAGKPYIFKATADDVVATFTGTDYTAAGAVNGLYGTYAAIAANTWDTYITTNEDLYLMTTSKVQAADKETSSLAANRAYIAMSEVSVYTGSEVKGIRLGFDGTETPTGINGLTPALSKGEGVIYNLNGQRVNSLQRGINIVKGKKVRVT